MKDAYNFSEARRGAVATGKTRITLFVDSDVLDAFRARASASGKGYQTLINETLRAAVVPEASPITQETLRRILREELRVA